MTHRLGMIIGENAKPGQVIALIGNLGAGKTFLSRAMAESLGIENPRAVTSPTFVLVHEYDARIPIAHFDVYRLRSESDFLELGWEEYVRDGFVCLIEWADKVQAALPEDVLMITLESAGESKRTINLQATGSQSEEVLKSVVATLGETSG